MSNSTTFQNKTIILRERPTAAVNPALDGSGTFAFKDGSVSASSLKEGEVLVRVTYVSLDPAMRGWLRDVRSYLPPVQIGEVMRAGGVGTVVASRFEGLKEGDDVSTVTGWQEYVVIKGTACTKRTPPKGASLLDYLGPLGSTGQTAYWGLFDVGKLKGGEVVVVTGAAGSVGSLVVQLAKMRGCKVIAVAGADDKCAWLREELGADEALNYKATGFVKQYKEIVQKKYGYLDVMFDNVGGWLLDLSLICLKPHARIVLCGAISDYNNPKPQGLKNYQTLIAMRGTLQGFIVFDYAKRYAEAEKQIGEWLASGQLKRKFHTVQGLESCPEALRGLYEGVNTGKLVAKIA